jgi:hypothetical protein
MLNEPIDPLGSIIVNLNKATIILDTPDDVLTNAATSTHVVGRPGRTYGGAVWIQASEEVDPRRGDGECQVLVSLCRVGEGVRSVSIAVEVVKDEGDLWAC